MVYVNSNITFSIILFQITLFEIIIYSYYNDVWSMSYHNKL